MKGGGTTPHPPSRLRRSPSPPRETGASPRTPVLWSWAKKKGGGGGPSPLAAPPLTPQPRRRRLWRGEDGSDGRARRPLRDLGEPIAPHPLTARRSLAGDPYARRFRVDAPRRRFGLAVPSRCASGRDRGAQLSDLARTSPRAPAGSAARAARRLLLSGLVRRTVNERDPDPRPLSDEGGPAALARWRMRWRSSRKSSGGSGRSRSPIGYSPLAEPGGLGVKRRSREGAGGSPPGPLLNPRRLVRSLARPRGTRS